MGREGKVGKPVKEDEAKINEGMRRMWVEVVVDLKSYILWGEHEDRSVVCSCGQK